MPVILTSSIDLKVTLSNVLKFSTLMYYNTIIFIIEFKN